MNGFEYQAAAHMVFEGLVTEGLAVTRALHDRYGADRRNPWNEVECGDHYARSMASYGVFLGMCGFSCHGPKKQLGFAPRLTPEDFKAPFTTATGWGTFSQTLKDGVLRAVIDMKWGTLPLGTVSITPAEGHNVGSIQVSYRGKSVPCHPTVSSRNIEVNLDEEVTVQSGETIEIVVR
jgi:hypothetical protein